jgi:hypothetical protein
MFIEENVLIDKLRDTNLYEIGDIQDRGLKFYKKFCFLLEANKTYTSKEIAEIVTKFSKSKQTKREANLFYYLNKNKTYKFDYYNGLTVKEQDLSASEIKNILKKFYKSDSSYKYLTGNTIIEKFDIWAQENNIDYRLTIKKKDKRLKILGLFALSLFIVGSIPAIKYLAFCKILSIPIIIYLWLQHRNRISLIKAYTT